MKSTNLALFSALFFGCAIAYAQTPGTPSAGASAMSQTSTQRDTSNGALSTPRSTGQDKTTGNDMVSRNKKPPEETALSAPRSIGQDKTTGNDLVSGNKSGMQLGARPDFNTLDTNKNGYLTADDDKSHKYFSKCNLSHQAFDSGEIFQL